MKKFNTILIVALCLLVLGTIGIRVQSASTSVEIDNIREDWTSILLGRYGYGTVYNWSDTGRGDVKGTFQYYDHGEWVDHSTVQVSENHSAETNDYGSTSGVITYNFRGHLEAVWNVDNSYSNRNGFMVISGLFP